jgi:hypothetical protein
MNPALVSFELTDDYLLVIGHGSRDTFASMVEASEIIFAKVHETKATRLLVDYRELKINVRMNEAFNIVKRYEVAQPDFRYLITAAVFDSKSNSNGMEFGRYWQKVSLQRGFVIEIFEDIEEAKRWLKKQ